jgi:excisionase family DNA binding protein
VEVEQKRRKRSTATDEHELELLTVREVAQRLRVDESTVRRWIRDGVLETIVLPHRGKRQSYRIHRATIDKMFREVS